MLNTRQAAEQLGVTERQVLRYVHAGLLEAEQLGTSPNAPWVISDESLEKLVAQRAAQPTRNRTRGRRRATTSNEWREGEGENGQTADHATTESLSQ